MVLQHALVAFSIALILAPFSYYAGTAARTLRLPSITGYLISGIICGPYVLSILSTESVSDLNIIEGACLAVIGLAAGAELDLPSLSRSRKQVLGISAGICAVTWVLCFAAFDWVASAFPVLPTTDRAHLLAAATLGATLMMTRSPASAIAVLKEMDGKGPFSSLVMGVVVVKDVVVIVAYALNMEIIQGVILPAHGAGQGLQPLSILLPVFGVMLSMSVGAVGGLMLGVVLRAAPRASSSGPSGAGGAGQLMGGAGGSGDITTGAAASGGTPGLLHRHAADNDKLHHLTSQSQRYKIGVLLVVATAVFQTAHYFDAEPLLACVMMGMVVSNRRPERGEVDKEELHSLIANTMSITNVAFFGLAGASLKLAALQYLLWPALMVVAVRLVAIYVGSWLGCALTATHPEHRRLFWASMVTQAGVALGLARLAGTRYPDWGLQFQTYMMAIILVNLLIGPPLFRWSLLRVGEAKAGAAAGGAAAALQLVTILPKNSMESADDVPVGAIGEEDAHLQ